MRKSLPLLLSCLSATTQAQLTVTCTSMPTLCSNPAGEVHVQATGGVQPYSYSWNTGDVTASVFNLLPGTYTVTVTDGNLDQATCSTDVIDLGMPGDISFNVGQGGLSPCMGQCDGGFRVHYIQGLVAPLSLTTNPPMAVVNGAGMIWPYYSHAQGACPGQVVSFTLTDVNGCFATGTATIQPEHILNIDVPQTVGACTGNADGNATVRTIIPYNNFEPAGFEDVWVEDQFGNDVQPVSSSTNGDTTSYTITGLAPGTWTAMVQGTFTDGVPGCIASTPFTIPDLGFNCGEVSGHMHLDEDADCVHDVDEVSMSNQLMVIAPGPYYAITDANGDYNVGLPYGSYTMTQVNPDAVQRCPVAVPISFDVINGQANPVIDIADSLETPFDLSTHVSNTIARPGFDFHYWISAHNPTGYPGDPVTLDFTWSSQFTYVSADVVPTTLGANSGQWQLPAIPPFSSVSVLITLQVPANPGLVGTYHTATLVASSIAPENNMANNTYADDLTVMGSYDPNDKQALTSTRTSDDVYFMDLDEHIDYTIRFQNTGNDTAFTVVVTDTISELLDLSSLELLGASHAYVPSIVGSNLLKFTFNNILLPDSNTNEPLSHGFVSFRIKPTTTTQNTPLLIIANSADIYFDFNPAVRTNTTELLTDMSVGIAEQDNDGISIHPVPVADVLYVHTNTSAPIVRMQVLSIDGRMISEQRTGSSLDASSWPSGAYVLRVLLADGTEQRARFVKR